MTRQQESKTHHFHDWDERNWLVCRSGPVGKRNIVLKDLTRHEAIDVVDRYGSRNPGLVIVWNTEQLVSPQQG